MKKAYLSLSSKLLLIVASIILFTILIFTGYMYRKEDRWTTEITNAQLESYNRELHECILSRDTNAFNKFEEKQLKRGIRSTIIDYNGNVLYDNEASDTIKRINHSERKEIQMAMREGTGYDIERESASLGGKWFYTANAYPEDSIIVRSSRPYDMSFMTVITSDKGYLLLGIMICIVITAIYILYLRKIQKNITLLKEFATLAERNEDIGTSDIEFADDELGDISRNIVRLYAKLHSSEDDKARLKHQLTQNIAHELKTPVSSIIGYLETILDNPNMDEQTKRDFLQRCFAQSNRLGHIISDITLLTKIDEASQTFSTEIVNISEIIDSIRKDVELQLMKKHMTFLNLVTPDITIEGNQLLIYSIFRNLTDNAIAYAGEETTIIVQCIDEDTKCYKFDFSDNGCGVPKEKLPYLFERFYRVDKGRSRKLGGTGLGLSIVKNAVMMHGGKISVTIAKTGGLDFAFTLSKTNN